LGDVDQFSEGLLEIANEILKLDETPRRAAELAVPKIQELLDGELSRGVDPEGSSWEPLKDGSGRVPFSNPRRSRDAMTPKVEAIGKFVRARISGWSNVHQNSRRASLPQRRLVPRGGLTLAWEKALDAATEEAVAELAPKLSEGGGIQKK
jgi:hypothetical protein